MIARARHHFLLLFFAVLTSMAQQGAPGRVVDLAAPDGAKLKGTYFAAAKPGPGVLLLHQCNRQRKIWDDLGAQLAAAGINVLTFDLRGFGESDGAPFDKLTPQEANRVHDQKWPSDIDTAFHYLVSQPGVKPDAIGVGGASCGVDNSLQTARRHPKEVKSLVLLSGGTDLGGRQFLRQSSQLPVLFSVADDDEFPPTPEIMAWLYSLSPNLGKKWVHYEKGGHGADMFQLHPELRGVVVDWFTTTLIKTPGRAPAAKDSLPSPAFITILNQLEQPDGMPKAAQMLADAQARDAKRMAFMEEIINVIGYEHLQAGDNKAGLEILKMNAGAFPQSPNVYDSLADAYLADGQKDLARQNAKKALELLPTDTVDPEARRNGIRDAAQRKLKQLGDGPQ